MGLGELPAGMERGTGNRLCPADTAPLTTNAVKASQPLHPCSDCRDNPQPLSEDAVAGLDVSNPGSCQMRGRNSSQYQTATCCSRIAPAGCEDEALAEPPDQGLNGFTANGWVRMRDRSTRGSALEMKTSKRSASPIARCRT